MTTSEDKFVIVCIDTDTAQLEQLSDHMNSLGYQTHHTSSTDEAIGYIAEEHNRVVLIIADYYMNKNNNLEEMIKWTSGYGDIPVAVLVDESVMEGMKANHRFELLIPKPISRDFLVKKIPYSTEKRREEIEFRKSLKVTFLEEAEAILEEFEVALLAYDIDPANQNLLNDMFRRIHTIKGSSSVLDDDNVRKFSHRYEEFLSEIRAEQRAANSDELAVCFQGFDILKDLIERSKTGEPIATPRDIFNRKEEPALQNPSLTAAEVPASSSALQKLDKQTTSKVSLEVLSHLEYLAAEITIQRNMMSKLLSNLARDQGDNKELLMFASFFEEMSKYQSVMSDEIKKLRTTPFAELTRPLTRVVRDLEKSLKKKVKLVVLGTDICLDRRAHKILSDCLIHLIRNCLDHGIELPAQRSESGKNETAEIILEAREYVQHFVVQVKDDGRGINPDIIAKKAIDKEIITSEEADKMSEAQLIDLIFAPGFSTADQVTDVSGRGVGTDMVRASLIAVGGQVEVNSKLGEGSTFVLTIPKQDLSVSIESLLIRLASQTYTLPQHRIIRLCEVRTKDSNEIVELEGSYSWNLDGSLIPLLFLSQVLDVKTEKCFNLNDCHEEWINVVIVNTQNNSLIALIVDEIIDLEQVVLRQVNEFANSHGLFRGAALLNDGTVGLVLDIDGLYQFAQLDQVNTKALDKPFVSPTRIISDAFVLVETYDRNYFALQQSEVLRVELTKAEAIMEISNKKVIRYNEQIVEINDLSDLLGFQKQDHTHSEEKGDCLLLLAEVNQQLKAYVVAQVIDLIEIDSKDVMHSISPSKHILGHYVDEDRVFNLISLKGKTAPKEVPVEESKAASGAEGWGFF